MTFPLRRVAMAALLACVSAAQAADGAESSIFSFSGFGTLGLTKLNTDLAEYRIGYQKEGAKDSFSIKPDTKLGAQVNAAFNDTFSASGQLISRYNVDGNWKPEVQGLFAKAKLSRSFSVRAGRIGAPLFMVSDFRSVDYANTWLRPPLDVYGQVSFDHFDGMDLLYQGDVGDASVTAQLWAGSTDIGIGGGDLKIKKLMGVNATAELGTVTLRFGHTRGKLNFSSPGLEGLLGGLRAVGAGFNLPQLITLADELSLDDKQATFTGVGASVDWNNVVGLAEYTVRKTESYVADTKGWYATLGYRFGKFTPYVTVSKLSQTSPTSSNAVPPIPALAPLAAGVNGLLRSTAQHTTGLGLRWDAGSSYVVKAQVEKVKVDDGGTGLFDTVQPGFDGATVLSLAVNFVF